MSMAPGWYPDPFSVGYVRWWDGKAWGSATQVAQRTDEAPTPTQPVQPTLTAQPVAAPAVDDPAVPPAGFPTAPPYGAAPYGQPYGAPQQQPPPWAGYQPYPLARPAPAFPLAAWGTRAVARIIDLLIIWVVMAPLYVAVLWPDFRDFFDRLPTDGSAPNFQVVADFETSIIGKAFVLGLLLALAQLVYEVPQLVAYGRTLGKRVMGIRVRALAQDRYPTWGEATGRVSVMAGGQLLLSGLFTLLDCLWPLWDKPWQQALHDKVAKTVVVPK